MGVGNETDRALPNDYRVAARNSVRYFLLLALSSASRRSLMRAVLCVDVERAHCVFKPNGKVIGGAIDPSAVVRPQSVTGGAVGATAVATITAAVA